jgi:hypothetical protein
MGALSDAIVDRVSATQIADWSCGTEIRHAIVAPWEGERLPNPLYGVRILAIALELRWT